MMREAPNYLRCLVGIALALVLVLPAQHLQASVPVIDVANLQQAILKVSKAVTQINNQLRQIQLMRAQLDSMELNLRQLPDPNWRDLGIYMLELNEWVRQGDSLGYSRTDVFEVFREATPGFVPIVDGEYEHHYEDWNQTALDTFAATLESAKHQSRTYFSTQEQLGQLQDLADGAVGNLEALNAANMLQGHTAQEVAKLNQLLAANLNAQNVYFGVQMSMEAGHEATLRDALRKARRPFVNYTGDTGLTAIPDGWPYPCYGCVG